MKVLFDHNVPAPLRHRFPPHVVITAREMGWDTLENGELIAMAEDAGFDLVVTGDKNLAYQQNLAGRKIALIVLRTIRWKILRNETALITNAVKRAAPGSFEQL